MNVSIIIPAYNAAETIDETLNSVSAQTFRDWEAIVVDDGSTDETEVIARSFATRDSRIRVISQPNQGGPAARNAGAILASFDWLLFLDADDWLLPDCLKRMAALLSADPSLDAGYCGWDRITIDGKRFPGERYFHTGDLFHIWARRPLFPPHACILRRSLVEAVGGWDTSFQTCQEWDFFQRFSRTRARFGAVHEVLVHYRLRPRSVSREAPLQTLMDGVRVIQNGHSPDPRVPIRHNAYPNGFSSPDLASLLLISVCWPAGLALSLCQDACALLNVVRAFQSPELNPHDIASSLLYAVPFAVGRPLSAWPELWPDLEERLNAFLHAFEVHSTAADLAIRARTGLEELILENLLMLEPLALGTTYAISVEATRPLVDVTLPPTAERLLCRVELEGGVLGKIVLEAKEGLVTASQISNAIATEFTWSILGRFFERILYPQLKVERQAEGIALWRGSLCLTSGLPDVASDALWPVAYDQVGWLLFLQEVWALPDWPTDFFYDPQKKAEERQASRVYALDTKTFTIEISEALPDILTNRPELDVVLTIGGIELGQTTIPVHDGILWAQQLRAALTTFSGFELCRLAVRVGLIGQSLADPLSLQARLARATNQSLDKMYDGSPSNNLSITRQYRLRLKWLRHRIKNYVSKILPPFV